jgi:hypothetical protein
MSSLFGGSRSQNTPPPPPEQPKAPTIDDATKIREETDARLRRRRGRAALMLTNTSGSGSPQTSAPTLTGGPS